MFNDYNFIDNFLPYEDFKTLFRLKEFRTKKEFLEHLEDYHILTTLQLVSRLNKYYGERVYECISVRSVKRNPQYESLETAYDVIIHQINSRNVMVAYDKCEPPDFEKLKLELSNVDHITFKAVTPVNLRNLKGITLSPDKYDYWFMLRVMVIDCANVGGSDLHIMTRHDKALRPYYTVDYRRDIYTWRNNSWKLTREMVQKLVHSAIEKDTAKNRQDIELGGVSAEKSDLLNDGNYQLRIAVVPALDGYKMTIRIQKLKTVSKKIKELGFDSTVVNQLELLAKKQSGITLITGAIRTGKNTTAFAMANSMPLSQFCVMDLSSPVEVRMDFTQVDYMDSVDALINYIKLIKKLDVDICFINEIPSKDVAFAVRDLVNSSVGVITTMHVDRLWHLPYKLKEYYGEDYKDVISQINGVVNQKMFVQQCLAKDCAKRVLIEELPKEIRDFMMQDRFKDIPGNYVYVNTGCPECFEGNKKGALRPYAEVLLFDDDLKRKLRKCEHVYDMEDLLKDVMEERKVSLDYKLVRAVKNGELHYKSLYVL